MAEEDLPIPARPRRRGWLRLALLGAIGLFVWRHHAPRVGFVGRTNYPSTLGAPEEGHLRVERWSSTRGGAAARATYDLARIRVDELRTSELEPQHLEVEGPARSIAERWPGAVGDALAHLWFARNALLHCPPGTWRSLLAFAEEGVETREIGDERHVLVPSDEWRPVTERALGRHRIELEVYHSTHPILSTDHPPRFLQVAQEMDWVNITGQRRGLRFDIVVRWFARDPNRELLVQRFAFIGRASLPVAIEVDWADMQGKHVENELYSLHWAPDAAAPFPPPSSAPTAASELRAAHALALSAFADPWSDEGRAPDAPVIGPLKPGFADPAEAFAPWKSSVRKEHAGPLGEPE